MRRGEVYHVDFGPGVGHEPAGRLPAVLVTNDTFNVGVTAVVVIPAEPVGVGRALRAIAVTVPAAECGLPTDHQFLCHLVRAVDPARVVSGPTGQLPSARMAQIEHVLRGILDLHHVPAPARQANPPPT